MQTGSKVVSGVAASGEDKGMSVQFSVERVGPEQARQYLAKTRSSRSVSEAAVRRYAETLERGEWELNGEPIKFDIEGYLVDGQRRLKAVVESGVLMDTLVARGVSEEAREELDTGTRRTVGDALAIKGESRSAVLASALAVLHRYYTGKMKGTANYPSVKQALSLLEEHPSIRDSLSQGEKLNRTLRAPSGLFAAMHYIFSGIDETAADRFFDQLLSGANLHESHPVLVLRRVLERDALQPRPMPRVRLAALAIKAWNADRENKDVSRLGWVMSGPNAEDFPTAR